MADAAAGPERRTVVARLVGVWSVDSKTVAARIDQLRVTLADGVGTESQAFESAWPKAGQQNVSGGEHIVEYGEAVRLSQVERDGALAPIGKRHGQIHAATVSADALGRQTAVRVPVESFDADHVGAPIGQQGTGNGHENPLGEFDDTDAVEGAGHVATSVSAAKSAAAVPSRCSKISITAGSTLVVIDQRKRPCRMPQRRPAHASSHVGASTPNDRRLSR